MKKIKYILASIIFVCCLTAITPTYADDETGSQGTVNGVPYNSGANGNNGNGGNDNGNNGNAYGAGDHGNGNGNNGNGNGNGGSNGGGAALPINGGVVFLMISGLAMGTVVIYKNNKKVLAKATV